MQLKKCKNIKNCTERPLAFNVSKFKYITNCIGNSDQKCTKKYSLKMHSNLAIDRQSGLIGGIKLLLPRTFRIG